MKAEDQIEALTELIDSVNLQLRVRRYKPNPTPNDEATCCDLRRLRTQWTYEREVLRAKVRNRRIKRYDEIDWLFVALIVTLISWGLLFLL